MAVGAVELALAGGAGGTVLGDGGLTGCPASGTANTVIPARSRVAHVP